MIYRLLADIVVVTHLLFIIFALFGGLLVLWHPRLLWVHLPALAWGIIVELAGFICPLTPLENGLRARGGDQGYSGGFIEHYLEPVIYPPGLTPGVQVVLGIFLALVNIAVYSTVWRALRNRRTLQ
jgi:hypothetical protein